MGIRLKEGLLEDPLLIQQNGVIYQNPSRSSTPFLRITAFCRLCQMCEARSGKYTIIVKDNPFAYDYPHNTHSFVEVNHQQHQHLPMSATSMISFADASNTFTSNTNQNEHNIEEYETHWFDWIDSLATLAKNYSITILSQTMPGYIQTFSCLPDLAIYCFIQDQLECIHRTPYLSRIVHMNSAQELVSLKYVKTFPSLKQTSISNFFISLHNEQSNTSNLLIAEAITDKLNQECMSAFFLNISNKVNIFDIIYLTLSCFFL